MINTSIKKFVILISAMSSLGLRAQWGSLSQEAARVDTSAAPPTVLSIDKPITYQGRVLKDLDKRKYTFISDCEASLESEVPQDVNTLVGLIRTGDLQQYDKAYINFHPIQVGLLNEYAKHPDYLHRQYVLMSFDDDVENSFVPVMDAIDERRKTDSTAFNNFQFVSMELYGKGNGGYLEYSDREYEYALAAYLNALFPLDTTVGLGGSDADDSEIPARIRSQVEGIRSMVSVGLWRLWQEEREIQVPSDEDGDTEDLDVDPSFSAVETFTLLRDSLYSISKDLEAFIPVENREAYQLLRPWLMPIPRDSVNDRVLVGESFFEQLEKRSQLIDRLKNEKKRVVILSSDPLELLAVNAFKPKVLPSLLEDLLASGVDKNFVARVFQVGVAGIYDHVLLQRNLDSAFRAALNVEIEGDTIVSDSQQVFSDITKRYLIKDGLEIQTIVLREGIGLDEMAAMDSAASVDWDNIDSDYEDSRSRKTFMQTQLALDVSYSLLQPTFRTKYITAIKDVMMNNGMQEITNWQAQGIGIGVNTVKGKIIQNHRLQIMQTSAGVNNNYQANYVLYSDMSVVPLGRFFSMGFGGFTGYAEQRVKNFTGFNGGFITQDQPGTVVRNPAYLYGLTAEPSIHIGPFFARVTGGYAWDLGESTWKYQNQSMNSGKGGFKSTGWYVMGELGLHWDFSESIYSGSSSTEYDDVVTDSVSVGLRKVGRKKLNNTSMKGGTAK